MVERNQALVKRNGEGAIALRAKQALDVFGSTGSALRALGSFVFPGLGIWEGSGGSWGSFAAGWMSVEPRGFPYGNINAYNSSVVMSCVNAITGALKMAPPRVYKMNEEGTKTYLPGHRLQKLFRRPNPSYSWRKLIGVTSISYNLKGNAYWYRERANDGMGATLALYYIPHFMITPKRPLDGSSYVSHYEYNVDGKLFRLRPDQVIHFKYDIDPYNTLMGRDPLQPVYSGIFTDEEADKFTATLLRNSAMPGVVISPEQGVQVKPADAEALKENYKRKFGGDNRGEPLVLGFAGKLTPFGFSMRELQMKELRRLPEERVAAIYRIAASWAGLGAGLDHSTYSNMAQAERHSYQTGIVPIWDEWGDDLGTALQAEFFGNDASYGVEFDYSKVPALQEDADAKAGRTTKLWVVNGIDRAELRGANGYPVDEARDAGVFYADTKPAPVANPITGGLPPGAPPAKRERFTSRLRSALQLKAAPAPNLDNAYDMSLEADVQEVGGAMQKDLDALFTELARAAGESAKGLDRDNPQAETERILEDIVKAVGIEAALLAIWGSMGEDIEDATRITVALRLAVPFASVWDDNAKRITQSALRTSISSYDEALREQTRKAIEEAIRGAEAGESVSAIARKIKANVNGKAMYPGIFDEAYNKEREAGADHEQAMRAGERKAREYRANLIAEAETRTYQNNVALESMAASGVVDRVRVEDGGACGWRSHNDKDLANGTTRLLSEARRYPTVHPRCKRRFYPAPAPTPDAE